MDNQNQPPEKSILGPDRQQPLPNATTVLVLGIISIVGCFCYGVGIIFGIVALILAKKDLSLYYLMPDIYSRSSFSNLSAGRTCAIVGTILSGLYIFFIMLIVMIGGSGIFSNPESIFRR